MTATLYKAALDTRSGPCVAAYLDALMMEHGLTVGALQSLLHVSSGTLLAWRRGERVPTIPQHWAALERLACPDAQRRALISEARLCHARRGRPRTIVSAEQAENLGAAILSLAESETDAARLVAEATSRSVRTVRSWMRREYAVPARVSDLVVELKRDREGRG